MIDDLDRSIERLFILAFGSPLPFDLSYRVPDNNFTPLSNSKNTLDCYLYDIQENRELRSVEPVFRRVAGGLIEKEVSPVRIKISYCITAWSAATPMPGTNPEFDEHLLLGNILRVLLSYPIFPTDALVGTMKEQPFPLATSVIQTNNAIDSRAFWNAIGGQLRPSLDYSVTIAQSLPAVPAGPMVTTLRVDYKQAGASQEEIFSIGGRVVSAADPERGIAAAEVIVVETGLKYVSDENGRFLIDYIIRGVYTLRANALGFQEGTRIVQVPLPDGSYNLELFPSA